MKIDKNTLVLITEKLLEIDEQLQVEIAKLEKLETSYWQTYYKYLFQALERTEALREAAVKSRLEVEGVSEPYQDQKLKVRLLLTRKEMYFEISRNLRILQPRKIGGMADAGE